MKRYYPQIPLPPYAFIPGQHPHPEKKGGHMHGYQITAPALHDFKTNSAYLYGVDLFNHQYYWESHVWWEYLWHLENRQGDKADLLKGLIKLAAANLKERMGQKDPASDHYKRAQELFAQVFRNRESFLGIKRIDIEKAPHTIVIYLEG